VFYDAATSNSTQFLLEQGYDYEDPHFIIKSMRETYFHGSGFINTNKGSNNHAFSEMAITNFQYDSLADI